MSSTLKKSLIRVKSTINKKLTHGPTMETAITPQSSSNNESPSDVVLDQDQSIDPASMADYFSMKYEDLQKENNFNSMTPSRKRNFSQTNSIASNSQTRKSSTDSAHPDSVSVGGSSAAAAAAVSRSHSVSSSVSLRDVQETTDTTLLLQMHDEDPLSQPPSNLDSVLDPLEPSPLQQQHQQNEMNQDPELLPPIPTEGQPPCNNEELSPVLPSLISPSTNGDMFFENFSSQIEQNSQQQQQLLIDRQNSCTSTVSLPVSSGMGSGARPRLYSSLRSSITSQNSLPLLSVSTGFSPIQESANFSTLHTSIKSTSTPTTETFEKLQSSAQSRSTTPIHNDDDLADAMAISILEKVPHTENKEVSVDDWCI